MEYHRADYADDEWDTYWYSKNLQGDITGSYTLYGSREMFTYYSAFGYMKEDLYGYNDLPENPFMYKG
jgi:hypothetical protein